MEHLLTWLGHSRLHLLIGLELARILSIECTRRPAKEYAFWYGLPSASEVNALVRSLFSCKLPRLE